MLMIVVHNLIEKFCCYICFHKPNCIIGLKCGGLTELEGI